MKKYFYMAVAAIAALSSCSNNDEFEPSQTGKQALVFTATMEGSEGTRATYDSGNKCASWVEGDQISINGKTYKAQSAGLTTTFKAADEGQEAEGSPYYAYFACTYDGTTATLPAEINEAWAEGKFNMPMYANSETTSLKFYNLCGVLKITVKSDQLANVKSITVSSANCATSGVFSVDDNNAAVLTDASNTANTVTVTYTEAVTTDATGKVFYVAVPAQIYKKLSIAVSDGTTTKLMTTKADQDITVARKTVYPITFNGQPTTGTEKRSSKIDVKWVQLWAGGPKFAEYNVGGSSATSYGSYCEYNNINTTFNWGDNWRIPTKAEFEALVSNCTFEWTQVNSVNGCKYTGKGAYASNSMFLPAAGTRKNGKTSQQGNLGYYYSITNSAYGNAWMLYFGPSTQTVIDTDRYTERSLRAVLAE